MDLEIFSMLKEKQKTDENDKVIKAGLNKTFWIKT